MVVGVGSAGWWCIAVSFGNSSSSMIIVSLLVVGLMFLPTDCHWQE